MKLQDLFENYDINDARFRHGFDSKDNNLKRKERYQILRKKIYDAAKKMPLQGAISVDQTTSDIYGYKQIFMATKSLYPTPANLCQLSLK